jgi:single-stranded DNA-binding protein
MAFEQTTIIGTVNRDPAPITDPDTKEQGTRLNVEVSFEREDTDRNIMVPYRAWMDVQCFGGMHERARQLAIGAMVLVVGRIDKLSPYTDKQGKPRASMTIRAFRMEVLDDSTNVFDDDMESH